MFGIENDCKYPKRAFRFHCMESTCDAVVSPYEVIIGPYYADTRFETGQYDYLRVESEKYSCDVTWYWIIYF